MKKLFAVLLLSSLALSENVSNHLVSVQHSIIHWSVPLKVQEIQSSGICISRDCSVVATAAHTEMLLGQARLGIEGARTEKVLSAANESDSDTDKAEVPIRVSGLGKDTLSYNLANDIAFIYTRSAVHRKSGIPHFYKSYVGQKVRIAGFYKNRFTTAVAHIIGVNVPLRLGQGQLNENLIVDVRMEPGSSGSAVLDEQGNLLGMITLCGAIKASSGDVTASVALTTRTIAKALVKLDPLTAAVIFNDLSENGLPENDIPDEKPDSAQLSSANYQESELPDDASPLIPELSAITADVPDAVAVATLRAKAAAAGKAMVNIVAKQCLSQGKHKPLCHELAVVDGEQTFRRISSKGKLGKSTRSFPDQTRGVWTQSDWTETLGEIADNPWVFRGHANEKYIFSYKSSADDDRCYWEEYSRGTPIFGRNPVWKGSVACLEWVVTDKQFNVVAAFTEMYPPEPCTTQSVQTAMFYDWMELEGINSPMLFPVRESVSAKVSGQKKSLSADVSWTAYKAFRVEHKLQY